MTVDEFLIKINKYLLEVHENEYLVKDKELFKKNDKPQIPFKSFVHYNKDAEHQEEIFWICLKQLSTEIIEEFDGEAELFWNYLIELFNSMFEAGEVLTDDSGIPYEDGRFKLFSNNKSVGELHDYCNYFESKVNIKYKVINNTGAFCICI